MASVFLLTDLVTIMSPATVDTEHTKVLPYMQGHDPDHPVIVDPGSPFCLHLAHFLFCSCVITRHSRNCMINFTL